MFKGIYTGSAAAAAVIPFEEELNTNKNVSYNEGIITFLHPGYYEVMCLLNLTGVAQGDITAQIYNGAEAITESAATGTSTATTDDITLNVYDVINVEKQENDEYAKISVSTSAAATVSNSVITVKKIS